MRREILYLTDIVEAIDHIGTFVSGIDFEAFLGSEMIRSAVAQKLANHRRSSREGLSTDEGAPARSAMASNRRVSKYSGSRLFRYRLGGGVAGCQEALSRAARPGHATPRGRTEPA